MDLFDVRCLGVTIAKSSTECCSMANLSSFAVLAMQKKNAMDEDAIPVRFESSSSVVGKGRLACSCEFFTPMILLV